MRSKGLIAQPTAWWEIWVVLEVGCKVPGEERFSTRGGGDLTISFENEMEMGLVGGQWESSVALGCQSPGTLETSHGPCSCRGSSVDGSRAWRYRTGSHQLRDEEGRVTR